MAVFWTQEREERLIELWEEKPQLYNTGPAQAFMGP